MQKFYAGEMSKLADLLKGLNAVFEKYHQKEADTFTALLQWLNGAIGGYKQQAQPDNESLFQSLKAELLTAQRGIHPLTFEKVSLRRHELQMTAVYKALMAGETKLRSDLTGLQETLKEASALVSQIIVAGLQAGLLTPKKIKLADTQNKQKALWKALAADANIALGQARALLLVSEYDVMLLFGDLLANLKNQA